ncbi:MAG: NADPH-dependent F420 reductase [Nocardioidaceae bacterium]
MTTIGFVGSGNIGGTLAQLAVDADYDVVVSNSRGPETLADLVQSLGPRARAATSAQTAAAGDIVVVTIPLGKIDEVPVEPLAGKVVIDTCNYYPERDGAIPALDDKQTTTSGLVQQHLASAEVVKAFNNIFFKHLGSMQRPGGAADRNTLMIAGDDDAAKKTASDFIDAIGYDVFDTGSLADSWRFQRDQPAYAGAYAEGGDFDKPKPADRSELQALLDQADATVR